MPAGERRAAQTLIVELSADRPEDGRRILRAGRRFLADDPALRRAARLPELSRVPAALQDELAAQLQSPAVAARERQRRVGQRGLRRCSRRRSTISARPSVTCRRASWTTSRTHLADPRGPRLSDRRPLHRSDGPLHGGASAAPAHRCLPPGRSGKHLARPADRHGQARRAGRLRHPPLSGEPGRASPRRRNSAASRSCCSPTNGCRRSPASPAMSSPGARRCRRPGIPRPRCSSSPRRSSPSRRGNWAARRAARMTANRRAAMTLL